MNPSWSPTGTRIIADVHTSGDSADVHTTEYVDVATGATTAVRGTPKGSKPSWQPLRKNSAGRVWGSDVYASNIASSRWTWNTYGGTKVPGLMDAKAAVLINRDDSAYSLTAPALAGKKHGPVLGTTKSGLTAAVKNELKRTLKPGSNVYLIGGTSILTSTVSSQVTSLGFTPKRLSGTDHYAISVAVAKFWWTAPSTAALAYTNSWRGGVSAGAAMNVFGPVLWTAKDSLSSEVKSYLLHEWASTNSVFAFGGTGSVAKAALDTAGAAISASASQFVYHPYYDGVVTTASQQSTYAARTNGGQPATVARTGPTGADPHLDSLKTVRHQ
ncbi:cell wall-binding repeat-containing protein [Streptomyces siamensis]|uniref:Cell wall-binding repeat-containing protein n=1 Tax=Streptomyces siamensis TaxID=1274986 RepID=A0ABP9J8I4_9ACTN